jgi:hypothetical protein
MAKRSVYRVSFYEGGQPKQAYVCAESELEASTFMGVRDGSASVSAIAPNVEVVGSDRPHPALPSAPINVAPPEAPKQLSEFELSKVRTLLARM